MASDIPPLDIRVRGFFNDRGDTRMRELLAEFCDNTEIEPHLTLEKGLFLAQSPNAFNEAREDGLELTEAEKRAVRLNGIQEKRSFLHEQDETDNYFFGRWSGLPWPLWRLIVLCAIGAAVQGWDEAAINAAQPFYPKALGIQTYDQSSSTTCHFSDVQLSGLINSAPYLSSAVSTWLAPWLNDKLGRRGTIFWCALFSAMFAFAQAFVQSWQELLIFRLLMGFGIGLKSATIPIYAAECAPANVRGSLVMFWQVWTAAGIMAGAMTGFILQDKVGGPTMCSGAGQKTLLFWNCSANWRLILASPCILPLVLAAYIYGCHESPRWTVKKAHLLRSIGRNRRASHFYKRAFRALHDLCPDPLLAARDMISEYFLLEEERKGLVERQELKPARSQIVHDFHELFRDQRNARALVASTVCMFAQQFCGINIIIYYSNIIFQNQNPKSSSDSYLINDQFLRKTYLYTMGIGIINLVFAIPAFFTIDTIGRRTLLLTTFPCMAFSHIITAIGLGGPIHSRPLQIVGMCLFTAFYSIGEGPIPFVYASESMPLHIREKGMSFVTSINWFWSWFIAYTGPGFLCTFTPTGTFLWYAAWCVILWFAILFLVPETRQLTLEELDFVFTHKRASDFAYHAWQSFLAFIRIRDKPPGLYAAEAIIEEAEPVIDNEQLSRRRTLLDPHDDHHHHSSSTDVAEEDVAVEHIEEKQ